MNTCRQKITRSFLIITVGVLITIGCSKKPTIVPVAGVVTIDGQPLKTRMITVYQKNYRPAVSLIQSDGSFILKTHVKGDGCVIGEHQIAVSSERRINDDTTEYFIPHRYQDFKTSELTIKVDGPNPNLHIDLTWKGSGKTKPYTIP